MESIEKAVAGELWYHGLLPREDLKSLLRCRGDFLVRVTEPQSGQPRQLVLSVCCDETQEEQGIRHVVIGRIKDKFCVDRFAFDTVPQLVEHFFKRGLPVTQQNAESILRSPVTRQYWELQHDEIELVKKLGEGAFGEVYSGRLATKAGKVDVAIKLAKLEVLSKEEIKKIMCEARLMRRFEHPNVVKFHGVAAGQEPLMVLMELVSDGALDSYLQKNSISDGLKKEMMLQAAWGIEYLHSKMVIHRDIAARNCLYGGGQVKISDFGLTREGTVYQMDPRERVPIRWLAPETLTTAMYTQKTDVYSYGILCWEILSNGADPYPGMTTGEVSRRVKEGYRMSLPLTLSPEASHLIMRRCWSASPNERADMWDIARTLTRLAHTRRPDFAAYEAAAMEARAQRERENSAQMMALMNSLSTRKGRSTRRRVNRRKKEKERGVAGSVIAPGSGSHGSAPP